MTIFFTADSHHRHRNILRLDERPFATLEEHDEELIRRWNEKVKPGDTVYHLGDFCFSGLECCRDFKNQLNGNIILILGNHDGNMMRMRKVFSEVHKSLVIDFHGRKVNLCHRPYKNVLLLAKYPISAKKGFALEDDGRFLIHGHTHKSGEKQRGRQINVNVLFWDFTPASEWEILKLIEKEENLPYFKRIMRRIYGEIQRLFT